MRDRPTVENMNAWLGIGVTLLAIGTSAVNIWLTIHNTQTEERIKAIQEGIEVARLRIQQDAAELEKSKEKTSRYIFVKTLLNDAVDDARSDKKMLTINLIRLALTDQEVKQLFTGLALSSNKDLRATGVEGLGAIKKEQNSSELASQREREGFISLRDKRYDEALSSFKKAYEAFPTYHNVDEITQLLMKEQSNFKDPVSQRRILAEILEKYSWGIPSDLVKSLQHALKE